MKAFLNRYWSIITKYLRNVIMFAISINIITFLSFGTIFNNYVKYMSSQLEANVIEYGEIDREQLCKISNCSKVKSIELNKSWVPDKKGHLSKYNNNKDKFYKINNLLYMTKNYDIVLYNLDSHSYYYLDMKNIISDYISLISVFFPVSLLLFIFLLIRSINNEQKEALIVLAGNEALLANKSMINITENIHHELNTPLEVIDNKIEKIHRILSEFIIKEYEATKHISSIPEDRIERNNKLISVNEDFDFIKTSSEQIYNVLEKMKGFKHLRYSNGNKTIKNIIEGSFKIINISNTNFEFKVDKKLANYKIDSTTLKNADLLSIMLNHIKNSLEASSSKIYIVFVSCDDNILKIRIIDNGNGIPDSAKADIFKANFSTKKEIGGIRGNGMYLNKQILKTSGGNIELISSSLKGTTIELSIPAKEK